SPPYTPAQSPGSASRPAGLPGAAPVPPLVRFILVGTQPRLVALDRLFAFDRRLGAADGHFVERVLAEQRPVRRDAVIGPVRFAMRLLPEQLAGSRSGRLRHVGAGAHVV